MHHFFTTTAQYLTLAIYALMMVGLVTSLISALRWGKKKGQSVRLMPKKWDWAYAAVCVVSSLMGVKIYHYWHWDLAASLTYYGLIPMVLLSVFAWINNNMLTEYRLSEMMAGQYPLSARIVMGVFKFFEKSTSASAH
jgi:cobalamin synthase